MIDTLRERYNTGVISAQRLWARLTGRVRPYRFDGERENHADTARETQVSIGLMAAAAQANTDEHRIQAWQTESGLRARRAVLLALEERTHEQAGELAAIDKGLADLHSDSMDAIAPDDRLWSPTVRPVRAPQRFLAGLAAPALVSWPTVLMTLCALLGLGAGVQTVRANNLKHENEGLRAERAALEHSRDAYAHQLAEDRASHARDVARVLTETARTVEQLQRQAARNRALQERERSRNEELASGRAIDFGERLRELARPADAGLPAGDPAQPSGDPASGLPADPGGHSNDDAAGYE